MNEQLFSDRGAVAVDTAVAALEAATTGVVPEAYVALARDGDGATFREECAILVHTVDGERQVPLRRLHTLTGDSGVVAMSTTMWSNGYLPRNMLVVADDQYGNQICLATTGDESGQVFFWDHERIDVDGDETWSVGQFEALSVCARSFEQFLEFAQRATGLPDNTDSAVPAAIAATFEERLQSGWRFSAGDFIGAADSVQVLLANDDPQRVHISDIVQFFDFKALESVKRSPTPLGSAWTGTEAGFHQDEQRTDVPFAPQYMRGVVLRGPIASDVRTVLEPFGELLPLEARDGAELWIFHCTNVVDALEQHARLADPVSEYVGLVDFWFRAEAIVGAGIFVLPQQPVDPHVFFTRPVVEELIAAGVRFVPFTTVWDLARDGGGPGTVLV